MGPQEHPRGQQQRVVLVELGELGVAPVVGSHVRTVQQRDEQVVVPDLRLGQSVSGRREPLLLALPAGPGRCPDAPSGWLSAHPVGCLWCTHTGDLARNPGMCLDWESSRTPFGSQASAQPTEPHQSGLYCLLKKIYKTYWGDIG